MKKIRLSIISILASILMSSCATYTRAGLYPMMYEEKPLSILVMPPINNTTNVEAKELLYTSISKPLIEAGYYVVSPHIAMEFLKAESGYDAERFIEGNISMFGNIFGADAVIFSIVDRWTKVGLGIQTRIKYVMKSTKTNEILFERTCDLYLDLSVDSGSSGILGALIDITASAIMTAATDHIVAARKCNGYIFNDIPRGAYSPEFGLDMETKASEQNSNVTVK
ncbi:MAG: DUF799 family lipoprotein [Bacteroidales bacterium]|nr:DUF799 family lipoprotein [Bacteroidales bacterium]MBR5782258.1 DUF799 family lipoprotein [Bacteroidales bacterium]